MLPADQVLVTIGTPCSISAVGSTETYCALAKGDRSFIGFAAADAGLVTVDFEEDTFRWATGPSRGQLAQLSSIESEFGAKLRAGSGIRRLPSECVTEELPTDLASRLPDHVVPRLREVLGVRFSDIRESSLKDMFGLFDDDPLVGPSLQSLLFLYGGLGALAASPTPLCKLLPDPSRFRVAAGAAFNGRDAEGNWHATAADGSPLKDKFATRLASSLTTHGPALLATMLAPAVSLSQGTRNPALLSSLAQPGNCRRRVPQAPLVTSGACASALIALADIATLMVGRTPGGLAPEVALVAAADVALERDLGLLKAFGGGALLTRAKLAQLNEGRSPERQRSLTNCLAPFDIDAQGTVVGEAGSGLMVTNLQFALRHQLDITSILTGWGQSGETGGKAHFAGVGFGGENATINALHMAQAAHGISVDRFRHFVAHATGTRTNSKTDLVAMNNAINASASAQGVASLPQLSVGAPKAIGDGHTMGETGLKSVASAIQYLLGESTVAIPTLETPEPSLEALQERFLLNRSPVRGSRDGHVLCAVQGFGGYNGAIALSGATPESLSRYKSDGRTMQAYLEAWPEIRRARVANERRWRRTTGFARKLAEHHCWSV